MIESRKREHSRKPDEQYDLIESCSPAPFLELFSRYTREGWTGWGEEAGPETSPRGKVHRGYQGGELRVPYIDAHVRLPDEVANHVAASLRERYESGASVRKLSEETGYSITRVRSLLTLSGATIRSRGRPASQGQVG